jgi:hypothetical protein
MAADSIFKQHMSADTASRSRGADCARVVHETFRPKKGRGECRAHGAPAASCARMESRTHTSRHGRTGITRHSRTQWAYGLYRALPGDRAFLPPSPAKAAFRELDASVGAPGPHGFAVRDTPAPKFSAGLVPVRQNSSESGNSAIRRTLRVAESEHIACLTPSRPSHPAPRQ